MQRDRFQAFAANERHPLWEQLIAREGQLHYRSDDIRSPFARDYTRILHSKAYRRLKHKNAGVFSTSTTIISVPGWSMWDMWNPSVPRSVSTWDSTRS